MFTVLFLLTILTSIPNTYSQPSPYGFRNQFIKSTNSSSSSKIKLCDNYWCINDANLLFTQSSQYSNIDPCIDFRNFSLSNTIEISQVNDRKIYRGLLTIAEDKQIERLRKILTKKVTQDENRITKVTKQAYQKCLKSSHTFRHLEAHKDAIKYLEALGGSPYLTRHVLFNPNKFDASVDYKIGNAAGNINKTDEEIWNSTKFDLEKIFLEEPHHALSAFFSQQVIRCPANGTYILCMKDISEWSYVTRPNFFYNILKELLESLEDFYQVPPHLKDIARSFMFIPGSRNVEKFLKARQEILDQFKNEEAKVVKIKDLGKIGNVDWLKVINGLLMKHANVDEDDEILIKPKKIEELEKNFEKFTKSTISDTFVLTFLYSLRHTLILRFFNIQDYVLEGRKQNLVRAERCLIILKYYIKPAIEVLYERDRPYYDYYRGDFDRNSADRQEIIKGAKQLAQESVDEMIVRVKFGTDFPLSVSSSILNKLKTAKIVVGFTEETLKLEELDKFYEDLKLNGNESFFNSIVEMRRNSWKIKNEISGSWRRRIEKMSETFHIVYNIEDGNQIFIPPLWILYPIYHPLRPRFLNMANFFQSVFFKLTEGILDYTNSHFNYNPTINDYNFEDNYQVTYENYNKWLQNHTELEIGANFLTNQQLYWVGVAIHKYLKYHRNIPKSYYPIPRLQMEYMHVWMKRKKGFQEAFNCTLTEEEAEKSKEYLKKFWELKAKGEENAKF